MRTFRVKVNGKEYEVEIEEIGNLSHATHIQPPKPAASSKPKSTPQPKAVVESVEAGDGNIIAPMPGTVLSVACNNGQAVKKGDVLLVLEAMKMENEIQSPADGVVAKVAVTKGQSVDVGELLVQLTI